MKKLTHNEIKEALAVKYQKACTVREKFCAATQRLLDEGGDIAEIMRYTEASIHINQLIDGLLLAAIALGISKEELDSAVNAAGAIGGPFHPPKGWTFRDLKNAVAMAQKLYGNGFRAYWKLVRKGRRADV